MAVTEAITPTTGARVRVPAWAVLATLIGVFACYGVLQENGLLLSSWETVHELFHDGRHALGFPCH